MDCATIAEEREGEESTINQNDSAQVPGETTDAAEEGDHPTETQKEIGTKAVGRIRKIPVTRTDDFLWTGNPKMHSR
jgi:hypothetical protein